MPKRSLLPKPSGKLILGVTGLLLQAALLETLACRNRTNSSAPAQSASGAQPSATDNSLTLPPNTLLRAIYTTPSSSILIDAGTAERIVLYTWSPGSKPKVLVESNVEDRTLPYFFERLADDLFLVSTAAGKRQYLSLYDSQKMIVSPIRLPRTGYGGWSFCAGDANWIACTGEPLNFTEDDVDPDNETFGLVLVVDVRNRKTTTFSVKDQSTFSFNAARKQIYLGDVANRGLQSPLHIVDLTGKGIGEGKLADINRSPSGQFTYDDGDGGEGDLNIYGSDGRQPPLLLFRYDCEKREKCVDAVSELWNPKFPNQIFALRQSGESGSVTVDCAVYQLPDAKVIQTFACSDLGSYDWSRDGRQFLMLSPHGGELLRQQVN
jgi:hypothetical protein